MAENQENFYFQEDDGTKTPLSRMSRAQCETVIKAMAEEIMQWRAMADAINALMAAEDGAGATLQ